MKIPPIGIFWKTHTNLNNGITLSQQFDYL